MGLRGPKKGTGNSAEHNRNISIARKKLGLGFVYDREGSSEIKRRKNISKARKGIIFTEEHRKNMSLSHKGKPTGRRPHPNFIKAAKVSRLGSNISESHKEAISKANKGVVRSKETRKKMSVARVKLILERGDAHLGRGKTDIEKVVEIKLIEKEVPYFYGYGLENRAIYDFYIPSGNLLLECDGDYWHQSNKAKIRDEFKNKLAQKHGFNLIRFKGSEMKMDNFSLEKIEKFLS